MQPEQKREVDALISQLETAGCSQQPRPLQNPLLFGNYNVAYTSSGDDQRGQRECSRGAAAETQTHLNYKTWSQLQMACLQASKHAWCSNGPADPACLLIQKC
jgi:hypothetical protein